MASLIGIYTLSHRGQYINFWTDHHPGVYSKLSFSANSICTFWRGVGVVKNNPLNSVNKMLLGLSVKKDEAVYTLQLLDKDGYTGPHNNWYRLEAHHRYWLSSIN